MSDQAVAEHHRPDAASRESGFVKQADGHSTLKFHISYKGKVGGGVDVYFIPIGGGATLSFKAGYGLGVRNRIGV